MGKKLFSPKILTALMGVRLSFVRVRYHLGIPICEVRTTEQWMHLFYHPVFWRSGSASNRPCRLL